jgi:hypothetical protein
MDVIWIVALLMSGHHSLRVMAPYTDPARPHVAAGVFLGSFSKCLIKITFMTLCSKKPKITTGGATTITTNNSRAVRSLRY